MKSTLLCQSLSPFVVGIACLLVSLEAAAAPASQPNVLFLFADDMRADSIGALGNPIVKTPNLDAIVQRGFVFKNAYCFGGNSPAVCTPSRNMMLSGNAYFRWRDRVSPMGKQPGMLAPGDAPNFPLSMQDAGYTTFHYGKRGNTALEIQAKFERNLYLKNDEGDRRDGEPGKEIVDEAIRFVKGGHDGKPFFMYLAFGNPHDPRVAAPKYLEQYDRAKLPLPKNFLPMHPFNNGEMAIRDEKLLPWPRTPEAIRQTHHEYYATITGLDAHIGRLLATLKAEGKLENTIIIISADQGIAIGSHGLLGKQSLYDAAMKSPLVFAGPGIAQGQSDALAYLFDIYPTVCDLAGAAVPAFIDGRSLRPVLAGKSAQVRDELLLSYRSVQRAWRDQRWKVIRYPEINLTQLFDLQADPDEMHNLAGDPAQAARVEQMLKRLQAAQAKFGDTLPLTVSNPQPPAWTPPTEAPQKN